MFLCKNLEVRSVGEKGRGVFATAHIPAGTLIADYLGVVLPPHESRMEDRIYEIWYSDLANLSPDVTQEDAYLVNHSCEANCGLADTERHTIICALRSIFPGEELTYAYMIGPEPAQNKIARPCYCDTPHCSGTLFTDPLQYATWEKWMQVLQKDMPEEPPVPYGEELPPLDVYPESFSDLEVYSVYGARMHEPTKLQATSLPVPDELRKTIRKTGRQIEFPKLGLRIDGVLFNGTVLMEPSGKKTNSVSPSQYAAGVAKDA